MHSRRGPGTGLEGRHLLLELPEAALLGGGDGRWATLTLRGRVIVLPFSLPLLVSAFGNSVLTGLGKFLTRSGPLQIEHKKSQLLTSKSSQAGRLRPWHVNGIPQYRKTRDKLRHVYRAIHSSSAKWLQRLWCQKAPSATSSASSHVGPWKLFSQRLNLFSCDVSWVYDFCTGRT